MLFAKATLIANSRASIQARNFGSSHILYHQTVSCKIPWSYGSTVQINTIVWSLYIHLALCIAISNVLLIPFTCGSEQCAKAWDSERRDLPRVANVKAQRQIWIHNKLGCIAFFCISQKTQRKLRPGEVKWVAVSHLQLVRLVTLHVVIAILVQSPS